MLFQITNTCHMGCPHCLDKATCEPMHMPMETFEKAVEFAVASRANVVLVSGGEPSLHPEFEKILERCCATFSLVALVSNGEWLGTKMEDTVLALIKRFPSLTIQITSLAEFYRRHTETIALYRTFALRLKAEHLKGKAVLSTDPLELKALGRCAENEVLLERTKTAEGTTSCFASALVAAQLPYLKTIENLESRGKFCHPLVDWRGKVHWSESWLCPSFGDVTTDSFADLEARAHSWRPCGGCPDYAKLMTNQSPKYLMAKAILGMTR